MFCLEFFGEGSIEFFFFKINRFFLWRNILHIENAGILYLSNSDYYNEKMSLHLLSKEKKNV